MDASPSPFETDDSDLLAQAKYDWRRAYSHWKRWRTEAKEDFAFVAGEQWSEEDKQYLMRQGRPTVVINRTAVFVDAVAGSEVQNRQELRFIPRELGDVQVNETITAAAKYFRDQCNAEDEESAAFVDCLTCGVGDVETRMDYDTDPDGTIIIERIDPFEVFWDSTSRRANFEDARYVFRVRDMSKEEVEHEWPGATDTLMPGAFNWGDVEDDEEEPHETIHGRQYELGTGRPGITRRRKYRVIEYQWKEWVPFYRALDPTTGQEVEFDQRRWDKITAMSAQNNTVEPFSVKQKRLEVRRAFFLGDSVLEEGPGPCPTHFSIVGITGKRDRNKGTWFGIVRAMKDPQRWANKFFSQMLHIINSNAKGGLLAESDAFDDPTEAENRWAESDSIIWMKPGGISRVSPKPMPGIPADITNLMQFCVQSLRDVTGINLELLGMQTQDQAGVLEYQRKQAGLTILATLFDSLRRYRKTQGRLLLYFMQEYIPDGTLVRIEGPQGAQFVPLMKQPETAQFDVVVDEAPSSPNLKEQVFSVMQVIAPQLTAMGVRIPDDALEYLPLPESLVQAIRKANAPQEGQQQQPQDPATQALMMQAQVEQQKIQASSQSDQAKLQSDSQLRMIELQADQQFKAAQLRIQQQTADVNAQVAAAQMQLEALKLHASMMPQPAEMGDSSGLIGQLADTVTQNHTALQGAIGQLTDQLAQHKQANADLQSRNEAMQSQLDSHAAQMQQLAAPREVVRDATGRITGTRVPQQGA